MMVRVGFWQALEVKLVPSLKTNDRINHADKRQPAQWQEVAHQWLYRSTVRC